MFERFTDRARRVVVLAQEEARILNHNYIGTEHILLGLIHEGEGIACRALEALGISLRDAQHQVVEIIGRGQAEPMGHIPFTPRAKKVLELSLREALQLGHNYIGTEHILLGLIREGEGVGAQVLEKLGADLHTVRSKVIELLQGRIDEPGEGPEIAADPKEQVRRAAGRARRARELADQLAKATGDPNTSGQDVFYGLLLNEERLLALEVLARHVRDEGQAESQAEGQGEEGTPGDRP